VTLTPRTPRARLVTAAAVLVGVVVAVVGFVIEVSGGRTDLGSGLVLLGGLSFSVGAWLLKRSEAAPSKLQ
jgi:hypothetical protein